MITISLPVGEKPSEDASVTPEDILILAAVFYTDLLLATALDPERITIEISNVSENECVTYCE